MTVTPKRGQIARVVLEGEVWMTTEGDYWVGDHIIRPEYGDVKSVEVLPEPWVPGDIVASVAYPERVWVRGSANWHGWKSDQSAGPDSLINNWITAGAEAGLVTVIRRGGKVITT